MGKDYPADSGGYSKFSNNLKNAFRNTPANTEEELEAALKRGEYVIEGTSLIGLCPLQY